MGSEPASGWRKTIGDLAGSIVARVPERGGARLAAAAAIGIFAGGVLGGVAKLGVDGGSGRNPARDGTASVGDLRLAVPPSWSRTSRGTGIAGLDGPGALSFDAELSRVVVTQVRAGGPSLLPSLLTRALATPLPAPVRVRAGRLTAYGYLGAIQRRPRTLFNVYVVATTRGVAAIACSVGTSDLLLVPSRSDCDRALAGLRLVKGRMLTPRGDTAFALALAPAIDGLAAARLGGRRLLATAPSPLERSRAATRVAAAYHAAARSLGPYSSGTPTELGTLGALSRLAGAYDALALGAARGDAAAFDNAASAIQAGERGLERRLEAWHGALTGH